LVESFCRSALRRQFNYSLKLRTLLASNHVQFGDSDVLHEKSENRSVGFNPVVLALIADENDPLDACFLRDLQRFLDLPGGQPTLFIDNPKLRARLTRQSVRDQAGCRRSF
jgi:hypothetical protein